MRKTIGWAGTLVLLMACSGLQAVLAISDQGMWPASWPKALEPLRARSRTVVGGTVEQRIYQIPFANRAEFEAAWPHLLTLKTKGAPLILTRAPYTFAGAHMNAGAVVYAPPRGTAAPAVPPSPIPGQNNPRTKWMATTFIELVVDGDVVDLNRLPLPPDTPIIDERFGPAGVAGAVVNPPTGPGPAASGGGAEGRPATPVPPQRQP